MSESRSTYQRTTNGLVGAIVAAVALALTLWGMTRLENRDAETAAPTVDYASSLTLARSEARFDVLAPSPEPRGWRATSVTWSGTKQPMAWHLGFLTDHGDYVGLEQGSADEDDFIAASTPADQPASPVDIDGVTWGALTSSDGSEHALVLEGDDVTTVVTGTASTTELVTFVRALRAG